MPIRSASIPYFRELARKYRIAHAQSSMSAGITIPANGIIVLTRG